MKQVRFIVLAVVISLTTIFTIGIALAQSAQDEPAPKQISEVQVEGNEKDASGLVVDANVHPEMQGASAANFISSPSLGQDFLFESEPNDDAANADPLGSNNVVVMASIVPATEVDWFSFSANAGDRVYAATMTSWSSGGSTDTVIDIIAPNGTTVLETDDQNGVLSGNASVIAGTVLSTTGTYYVRVDGFSGSSTINPYQLHVQVQSGSPTVEVEPNNSTATANPLPGSGWVTGALSTTADIDLYSFSLNAGDTFYANLDLDPERDATGWNGALAIGSFGGAFPFLNDDGAEAGADGEAIFATVKESGTYYVMVLVGAGAVVGNYDLSVSVHPSLVQANCTTYTSTDVPKTIGPAAGSVTSTINVLDNGPIVDLNATLSLTHTGMADLDVSLMSPLGTSINLFTDIGSTAFITMDAGIDDEAAAPFGTSSFMAGRVFQPEQPGRLFTYDGENINGIWTLTLADDLTNAAGGVLQGWSLELCVTPPGVPNINLNKTVGIDSAVCAATNNIAVSSGTDVTYCYEVTNTGTLTMTLHDLDDSELGNLLSGFAYSLDPGASVFVTETTNITETTTNLAMWTAYTPGPSNVVTDTASATVTVVPPSISLDKTVGTDPSGCATTDSIAVAAGTTVYYCYEVTNTGLTTFGLHDLVDDQLGTILSGFSYTLTAGSSVFVTQTAVITQATTNSATWTAYNPGPTDVSTADDTATVNIILPEPLICDGTPVAFELGIPTDWTVVDNTGGTGIVWTTTADTANCGIANLTNGSGQAACADSDNAGSPAVPYDTELVSNPFDLTAFNVVTLDAAGYYNDLGAGNDLFEVDVWDGSTWTNELTWDEDHLPGPISVDLSAYGGLNNVQVRFRYSGNGFDWYAEVDDVALSCDLVIAPVIEVAPSDLSSTQEPDTQVQQTLTISNVGNADLNWNITELPAIAPMVLPNATVHQPSVPAAPTTVTDASQCGLYENYAGIEPVGYDQYCLNLDPQATANTNNSSDPTDTGFAQDIRNTDNFVSFSLNNFAGQTTVGTSTAIYWGMDFDPSSTVLYAIEDDGNTTSPDTLGTIDLTTGAYTAISTIANPNLGIFTGLAIDHTDGTFYLSDATQLFTVDPGTGVVTLVGSFGVGGTVIDIDISPTGQMYGHNIGDDAIYLIDKTTGAATFVGLTGFAGNFAQGMSFDNADGTLYIFLYTGGGTNTYGTVNLTTGAVTPLSQDSPLGEFEGATQTAVPISCDGDIPWASALPISGTTSAGNASTIDVTFDSTGLPNGVYTGTLCVNSDDPITPLVEVPLVMTVAQAPPVIDVNPESLSSAQAPDNQVNQTLTISNLGTADLDWTIEEAATSPTILAAPAKAITSRPGSQSDATAPVSYISLADFSEGFDDITNLPGWAMQNNPDVPGTTEWFQGNDGVFPAHAGAATAYIGANYNNTGGSQISNWLMTPEVSFNNGGSISFWTRTVTGNTFPDRLEVRVSTNGSSTDVGSTPTSVGDFTNLEVEINPTLQLGGYPQVWTQFVVDLSPYAGQSGRVAFRYFVTDAGPVGNNSNYIGIDTVEFVEGTSSGCAAPSDISWASVSPISGTTTGGNASDVTVTFDSTGLVTGVYTGTLCIESNDATNPVVSVPLTLTVEAPSYGVALAPDGALTDLAGSTVTYTLYITNTGNTADTFNLAASGNSWMTMLSDSSVSLGIGESTMVWVTVEIPTGVADGDMDVATVTATSAGDSGVSASATLTTTAEVPEPKGYFIYLPFVARDN